jgi:hypothetical protein
MAIDKCNYVRLDATLLHSCQVDDGAGTVRHRFNRRKRPLKLSLLLNAVLVLIDGLSRVLLS